MSSVPSVCFTSPQNSLNSDPIDVESDLEFKLKSISDRRLTESLYATGILSNRFSVKQIPQAKRQTVHPSSLLLIADSMDDDDRKSSKTV